MKLFFCLSCTVAQFDFVPPLSLEFIDQQPSLSQLASLAGPQAGGPNGGGGALSAPSMMNASMGNLLNDNSTGSMNRMNNGMGGNPMGGMGGF